MSEFARLGELVELVGGGTPARGRTDYFGGSIPWITPKDMNSWDLTTSEVQLTEEGLSNSAARLIPSNAVLVVVRSGVLKRSLPVAINRVPAAINQDMKAMVCGPDVLPDYLARFLKWSERRILGWVRATTAANIPVDRLRTLDVPLPPIAEQRRIAAVLDKADAIRRKRQESLRLLDEFLRSAFLEMFGDPVRNEKGWQVVKLGDLLESIDSGWSPTCLDRPAREDEWAVLKLGAVTTCEFLDSENKALKHGTDPRPDLEVRAGDVLLTRKNTSDLVAACVYVAHTRDRLMIPDLIYRLRLTADAPVLATYLWQLLIQPGMRRKVQALARGSAGSMPNISKERLANVSLPIPPVELQSRFEAVTAATGRLKDAVRRQCKSDVQLFDSLAQRAFRGEL